MFKKANMVGYGRFLFNNTIQTLYTRTSLLNNFQSVVHKNLQCSKHMSTIKKPKRPANQFIEYFRTVVDQVKAENPGDKQINIVKKISNQWAMLDAAEKLKYKKISNDKFQEYLKQIAIYKESLTDEDVQEQKKITKEARKKKKEDVALDKPKRPVSPYILYFMARQRSENAAAPMRELTKKVAEDWKTMPNEEKEKYVEEARKLKKQYNTDIEMWKLKLEKKESNTLTSEQTEQCTSVTDKSSKVPTP